MTLPGRLVALAALALFLAGCPGPDGVPPEVAITSPSDLDTVTGIITVAARATDNDRVVEVRLLVDGVLHSTDSAGDNGRYEFDLNSTALDPESLHALACVAADRAGNRDTSAVVRVFVRAGTHHSGTIVADETWQAAGNPHVIEGELAVCALLRLEPGVEVQFRPGAALVVGSGGAGALRAAGTAASRIRFTANRLAPEPGDWDRLAFLSPPVRDTNLLRHCTVEFGGGSGAMVFADRAGLVVESCSLSDAAGDGIAAADSGLARLEDTDIRRCGGFPVRLDPMDVPVVSTANRFEDNSPDAVAVNPGAVNRNTRWERLPWPYCPLGFTSIAGPANPTLTIAPGCSLFFAESAGVRVGVGQPGALAASGAASFIYLGPLADEWQGIEFWSFCDPVRTNLRNCHVHRAGANGLGAVLLFAPAAVTGCRVTDSWSNGLNCVGAGFSQFLANEVSGADSFPLVVSAGAVGTLGTDNRLTGNGRDTVAVIAGRVTITAQWRNLGVPYLVLGEVAVGSGSNPTLAIDNGACLVFEQEAALVVGRDSFGALSCHGTPDSITFTARSPRPGGWRGIRLYRDAVSTTLDRCRLLYGGWDGLGILYVRQSVPTITNNEIGWSSTSCVLLWDTPLDPDRLRDENWLHDWNPDNEDVEEGP